MRAARLYGARDMRVERVVRAGEPRRGEVRIRVTAVGICGSDLHVYQDGCIGEIRLTEPLIQGHEFAGVVEAVGDDARGGAGEVLKVGQRVAVDPAQPCGRCELCAMGHPNLCPHHKFCGLTPTDGALCEAMVVPEETCFVVPDEIDDEQAALLEPLGVAVHALDLAHVKAGHDVLVVGAGPIGLLCAQMAMVCGAGRVFVADRLAWRLAIAERFGYVSINVDDHDAATVIAEATHERGVDVALECAWCDEAAVRRAVDALRPGGRLVVVGIPSDDRLVLPHGTARRKGLTIAMCRRMKHTYPRAIALARAGRVDLRALVSHRLPLERVAEGYELASGYRDGVVKVVVDVQRQT